MSQSHHFNGVAQIGILSADAPGLIRFYRDVLGFAVRFEANGMTFLAAGATSLMIAAGSEPVGRDVFLYFEPADWNAAEATLQRGGVRFEREAQVVQREGSREHLLRPFHDPEGRRLYMLGWRNAA